MRAAVLVLLAIALPAQAAPRRDTRAIVLLFERTSLEQAKAATRAVAAALSPDDRLAVISLDSELSVPLQRAGDVAALDPRLVRAAPRRQGALVPALHAAARLLATSRARRKQVIVVSDADLRTDGVLDVIDELRAARVTLSVVGVRGADRGFLAAIADAGDGKLYLLDGLAALPSVVR